MKIAIFGATGMAGSAITSEAALRGHDITAISRHPKSHESDRVTTKTVDVADTEAVSAILSSVDTAVLAVRPAAGHEHQLPTLTKSVLDAAQLNDVPVLVVGGAAPLFSPTTPGLRLIDDPNYIPEAWRTVALASLDQFAVCQEHPHRRWTYLSPPATFEPGPRTGSYVRGMNTLIAGTDGSSRISAADYAIAVLDEIENPGTERHITVAAASPRDPGQEDI